MKSIFSVFVVAAMLAVSAPAFSENQNTGPALPGCNPSGQTPQKCYTGGGGGSEGGGGGGGSAVVDVVNTITNTNQQAQGQIQGQLQGQLQGQIATGGTATATGGTSTSSLNVETGAVQASNTLSVASGAVQGTQTQTAVGGQGGSINIYGSGSGEGTGGEGGTATPYSASASSPFSSASNAVVAEGAVANSNTNSATVEEGAVANNNNVTVNVEAVDPNATREVTPPVINELPVASAAPSFSSICSSGAAGQGKDFALSLAVTNDVCMMLQMADAYMALGDRETAIEFVKKAGAHAKTKGMLGYIRHVLTIGIL